MNHPVRSATGITRSVQDQDNVTLGDLCGESEMYGHAGLHDALADFCGRWSDGLDILTKDAGAIGDSLSRVAQAYQAVDEAAAGSYPNGYVRFYNDQGQPVGLDEKPGPNSATHIPKAADGTYPVPEGW